MNITMSITECTETVWPGWPEVITVFDHETHEEKDYVPERTCHVKRHNEYGVLNTQWELSCGHTSMGYIEPHYCQWCGAKVVEE